MRRLVWFGVLVAVAVAGCGKATPTIGPEPTTEISAVQTDAAKMKADVDKMIAATKEARRPTSAPTRPPVNVPSDPDEFAKYMASTYTAVGDVDLGVTGDYMWLNGYPAHLILSVSKSMFSLGLGDISQKDKERWAAPLIRDMAAYADGKEWAIWYAFDTVETNAATAGENKVTWKDWMYVSDDYDTKAGGFQTTEYPIRISSDSAGRISGQMFVTKFDRMIGYFDMMYP